MNFDMFSGFMGSLPGMMYDQTSAGAAESGSHGVPGAALTLIVQSACSISGRGSSPNSLPPRRF